MLVKLKLVFSESLSALCILEPETEFSTVSVMPPKELAMATIKDLPEDTSWQKIGERIHFLAASEKSRREVRGGTVVPHEEVRNLLNGWLPAS